MLLDRAVKGISLNTGVVKEVVSSIGWNSLREDFDLLACVCIIAAGRCLGNCFGIRSE